MGRAPCCDKANVKKGPWSPEEDATLKDYIEKNGTGGNWIALPQKIGIKRCGKSCRLRWLNYLRPNIKHGGFTEEEDNIICSLYISIGSRWSIIAAQLPGRTDNDIKNYWNTRLKKKLLGRRKQSRMNKMSLSENDQEVSNNNGPDENSFLQNLSNSALERLQLHMQLQNLQNPFSFHNNPSLWPDKFHNLLDEKPHQTLENNIPAILQKNIPSPIVPNPIQTLENVANDLIYHDEKDFDNNMCDKVYVPAEQEDLGIYTLTHEVDIIDNSIKVGFGCLEGQMSEFECCLKQMGGADESNSTSSNSWESTSFLPETDGIYHDYNALWYNM